MLPYIGDSTHLFPHDIPLLVCHLRESAEHCILTSLVWSRIMFLSKVNHGKMSYIIPYLTGTLDKFVFTETNQSIRGPEGYDGASRFFNSFNSFSSNLNLYFINPLVTHGHWD